jgi:hypothetical protein
VQCIETAALHFLFFELLPFVNFYISFLSWPFLLNYIVHKATHPTGRVLVILKHCIKGTLLMFFDMTGLYIFSKILVPIDVGLDQLFCVLKLFSSFSLSAFPE